MRSLITAVLVGTVASTAGTAAEYRGRITPDAEYVLSGKLAADLPPLPDVPFSLEAPGFRDDVLSKAPPAGVHPRVVLSPDARAFKDNFYYFSRAGVWIGGLDYVTAYREGGADRATRAPERLPTRRATFGRRFRPGRETSAEPGFRISSKHSLDAKSVALERPTPAASAVGSQDP